MTVANVEQTLSWTLTTADNETISQDNYTGKTVLMFIGQDGTVFSNLLKELVATTWTASQNIQVVAVLYQGTAEKARLYQDQYAADKRIKVCYGGDSLLGTLMGSGTIALNVVAILTGGSTVVDSWSGCQRAEDCRTHLENAKVDLTSSVTLGLDVAKRTEEQINTFASTHYAKPTTPTYEQGKEPSLTAPYAAGVLDSATLTSALNTLNQMRFIAGLDANVELDSRYSELASAASLLNALNDELKHNPDTPAGMSDGDQLVVDGKEGAQKSNISSGHANLKDNIVKGWMADSSSESNFQTVGHRRWIINPSMGKVGFGYIYTGGGSRSYSAMYAHDTSGTGSVSRVAWPAQEMPVEYFNAAYPWSLSMGTAVDPNNVTVTLVREADSKTWTFKAENSGKYTDEKNSKGELTGIRDYCSVYQDGADYFAVNNGYYGQTGCIIFRPGDLGTISAGDTFDVSVVINDGTVKTKVIYTVHFFDLKADDPCAGGHTYENAEIKWSWKEDHTAATASRKCDRCDELQTVDATVTSSVKEQPTCTEMGTKTYTATATFPDPDGKSVTNSVDVTDIPTTEHSYAVTFTWTDDNDKQTASASATLTCGVCKAAQEVEATVTETARTKPTCEATGSATFTAKVEFGGKTYTDEGTHTLTLPATGHDYGDPVFTWTEGETVPTAAAQRACKNDPTHVQKAEAEVSVKGEPKAPDCVNGGTTVYMAKVVFDGESFSEDHEVTVPATGHNWDENVGFQWSEGGKVEVTATCKNSNCPLPEHKQALTAEVTPNTTPATCTTDGKTVYTAQVTFNGKTYTDENPTPTVIPKLGHTYENAEVKWNWETDHTAATASRKCDRCDELQTVDATVTSSVKEQPTCTEMGTKTYTATATFPDGKPVTNSVDVTDIPTIEHSYAVTFTWTDDKDKQTAAAAAELICSVCDDKQMPSVTVTETGRTAPACETDGGVTFTAKAEFGGKTYTDEKTGNHTLTLPATGHEYGKPTFDWAEDGKTAVATANCTRCGAELSETLTATAKPTTATCTEPGEVEYTVTIEIGGTEYSDSKTVTSEALGHDLKTGFTWTEDHEATLEVTCSRGDLKDSIEATVTKTGEKPATCVEPGTTTYTATAMYDGETYTDSRTFETEPALGHTYEDAAVEWNWETDYTAATASRNCDRCGELQTVKADVTSSIKKPATCTEMGTTTYTATATFPDPDGKPVTNSVDVTDIPTTEHSYAVTFTWADDNDKQTATASATLTCSVCNATQTVKEVTVTETRTEPSCETAGSVTFTAKAEFGGKTYTDAETGTHELTLPATGHDYGEPVFTWADGETAPTATAQRTCKNDPAHVQKADAKVSVKEVLKAPDCVNSGTTVYTAEAVFGDETFRADRKVTVPAADHKWSNTWSHDDNCHWHDCENANCPLADDNTKKDGYGAHNNYSTAVSDGNVVYSCNVCGTVVRTEPVQNDGDAGAMNAEVSQPQNTPAISIEESQFTGLLNPQDTALLAGGVDIDFMLDVSAADTVPVADKQLVEAALPDAGGVQYFDISLIKVVNDSQKYPINDTGSTMLTLTLTIPAELQGVAGREFAVVRVHDGGTALLSDWTSASGQTVTIQSNLFSTYALAWRDQKRPEPSGGGQQESSSGGNTSGSGNAPAAPAANNLRIPQTADDAPLGAAALALFLSLAGLGVTLVLRKRSR